MSVVSWQGRWALEEKDGMSSFIATTSATMWEDPTTARVDQDLLWIATSTLALVSVNYKCYGDYKLEYGM